MYSQFIELVQQSLYTVDAFPTLKNSRLSTEEIVYHLKKKSPDDDAPVDQDLVDDFMEITSSKRTNLHSGVGDWLDVKSFPLTKFPAACSDSRQELYRYLLEHNRIFRRGYDDRGRFMFNDCIADCLQFTLLNTTNGPSRLRPVPDIIPRELICLIAQMIKYRLEVGASTPEGQVTRRATSKSGNKVEAFGWGSCWDDAYKDMLNPSGNIGQYIKWQRVEEFITDKIVTTTTGSRAGKKSPEELWGDIRSIDDDESDTEVDADKYGPSRDKD
ncbi:hypothetical protein BJV82DRAFT_408780 [Fennellomyces sp. T-0311]|nr:hypothetical protein BJV82DRAFT_408780 [Fennellomyces sp. T-0311]